MPLLMVQVLHQDWATLHRAGMEWGGWETQVQKYSWHSKICRQIEAWNVLKKKKPEKLARGEEVGTWQQHLRPGGAVAGQDP